jgi:hypothetical protein
MNTGTQAALHAHLSDLWLSAHEYLDALHDRSPAVRRHLSQARRALVTGENERDALTGLVETMTAYTLAERQEDEIARSRLVVLARALVSSRRVLQGDRGCATVGESEQEDAHVP